MAMLAGGAFIWLVVLVYLPGGGGFYCSGWGNFSNWVANFMSKSDPSNALILEKNLSA